MCALKCQRHKIYQGHKLGEGFCRWLLETCNPFEGPGSCSAKFHSPAWEASFRDQAFSYFYSQSFQNLVKGAGEMAQ